VNLEYITGRMAANVETFGSLVHNVDEEQARWKPAPRKWSILELVNHMFDEERLDFRTRVDITLHQPGEEWPKIDPEGWVIERAYNQRDLAESFQNFAGERDRSIAWLGELSSPDWDRNHSHPAIGELRAGDILAAWLAHDLLHIRQLARLHVDYAAHMSAPYHIGYAKP